MLCTSLRQTLNIDHDNSLYGTGRKLKLALTILRNFSVKTFEFGNEPL